eukprot:TRINITY_DN2161_c0_g1_i1.p1 TRINITY_DN2161_c0_g1~~TRINITY_DN2161_c0_g1_i1.p1  ORF type:complete len:395 (+),score=139.65 TRINITY_DN2161_c0_g1_i1:110-1294(+)
MQVPLEQVYAGAWKDSERRVCHLLDAAPGAIEHVPPTEKQGAPKVPASEFGVRNCMDWAKKQGVPGLEKQLSNRVKKCSNCGKPNAWTLSVCNSCGTVLPKEETTTPNVFMCFVYGFEDTKLSLRYQDDTCMVLDDMLSLSPAHFNAVWAADWIPDFRWLFSRPGDGLRVLSTMRDRCSQVLNEQFEQKGYRSKVLRANSSGSAPPTLQDLIMDGMNYPPSQYQLHLQFIVLPMLPFQYAQYLRGVHYTKGRFFPCQYVISGLQKAAEAGGLGFPIAEDTAAEQIIGRLKQLGVDYDVEWQKAYDRVEQLQRSFAKWDPCHFSKVLVDAKQICPSEVKGDTLHLQAPVEGDAGAVVAKDKDTLQNYGRPYVDGKPAARQFYAMAKVPGKCSAFA